MHHVVLGKENNGVCWVVFSHERYVELKSIL